MVLTPASESSPGLKRPKEPDMINDPQATPMMKKDYEWTVDVVHRHHHGSVSPLPGDACKPQSGSAPVIEPAKFRVSANDRADFLWPPAQTLRPYS
jgi:hypothetical protein